MPRSALTGTRIRERRTLLGMKQADLARAAGISASYLNLIEHNRRNIGGKLLAGIARALGTEITQLTQGAEAGRLDRLRQAAAEAAEAGATPVAEVERIDEFLGRFPGWAAVLEAQMRSLESLGERLESLSDRLSHDPRLSSALHEVLSKVTAIRSAAAILVETEDIDEAWRGRFQRNLHGDSLALAERAQDLVTYLDGSGSETPETVSPWEELEAMLQGAGFHLPELEDGEPEAGLVVAAARLAGMGPAARALAADYLARAARDAAALPLPRLMARIGEGGDPAAWAAEWDLPVALVLRRMAAAPALPGRDPVGMVLGDGTGRILLRKSGPGFLVPRAGQACPLWPLYEALGQPGRPVRRWMSHAAAEDAVVEAHAVAEQVHPMGAGGPPLTRVWMVLLARETAPVEPLKVGSACRICPRAQCSARVEPSVLMPGF